MPAKTNAARILDRCGVTYDLLTYEVDEGDLSAENVAGKLGLPYEQVYKTLVARTDRREVVLVCVPTGSELNLKALGAAAGAKGADLVPLKDIQALTGYIRGGVSPLGSKKSYPLYIDQSAHDQHRISVSAGRRGLQLYLAPQDLASATRAIFTHLTRPS